MPVKVLAGTIDREALQKLLPAGLIAGEIDPLLPVRPVFEGNGAQRVLRGYTFETVDFEPARGYSGKPINLLVTLASDGTFLGVHLLAHREPIFLDPRGNNLLVEFARQYQGLTYRHNTQIVGAKEPSQRTADTANLTGVTQGTVSARAIDRAVIQSAIVVAQARIDPGSQPGSAAVRTSVDERYRPMSWPELVNERWLQPLRLSNAEVEARFAGTRAAGLDPLSQLAPDESAVALWLAPLSHAQVGRNLLDDKGWAYVRSIAETGQQVWLALDRGRLELGASDRPRSQSGAATAPANLRILLRQADRSYELQEVDFDHAVRLPAELTSNAASPKVRLLRTLDARELNANAPMTLALSTSRRYGADALQRLRVEWLVEFAPQTALNPALPIGSLPVGVSPVNALIANAPASKAWWASWQARAPELMILSIALVALTVALARPLGLAASVRRLRLFRIAYLSFTLVFIGWYAQAQLSIVNLTSSIEALRAGQDLQFLLFDPLTVCLWGFVLLTLFAWGRGTFCGWLCPFGALQELLSLLARAVGFKGKRLSQALDRRLKFLKYAVLAVLVIGAAILAPWSEQAVEVEPFKTAINMGFDRSWPYVAWAAICALSSVFVFRGYCRYICPLGAALALLGSVRLLKWIPRRPECGTPCQSCRHRCEYQAIKPSGAIDYRECFQCQDCVSIYQDNKRCLPLIRIDRMAV